jgi:Gpi18-like mannosyltransferase
MPFKNILKLFLIWQLLIVFITLISSGLLPLRSTFLGGQEDATLENPHPYISNPVLYSRANFDGIHYINIASKRSYGVGQQAFFPLYPRLIDSLSAIFSRFTVTGVVISSVSFLVGLYVFSKLIRLDYSAEIAHWTIVALLVFPVSYFFTSVYTEGLFFLLAVSSFYFARTGRWWLAGIIGAVASYTRLIGVFLLPAFLIEILIQNSFRFNLRKMLPQIIPVLLIPLGLLVYMNYLHQTTGDALAFIHAQKFFGQGRSEKIIMLYQVFWRYIKMAFTVNRSDPLYLTIMFEFATAIVFSVASVYSLLKQRLSYSLFSIASFILPTLTGTFTSLPRYVLICFPIFILAGQLISRFSFPKKFAYSLVNLLLTVLFLALFVRGYWVA